MPFSQSSQLSTIVRYAGHLRPHSVIDVGTGMGQYDFLLRNCLESMHLFEIQDDKGWQRDRHDWNIVIDGVEGFEGNLTPVHGYAYTRMKVGDARSIPRAILDRRCDLVLAIDILEHFDERDGEHVAKECLRIARRAALISTPNEFIEQIVAGNPLENHRSLWTRSQLAELGYPTVLPNDESWIAVSAAA